MSTLKLLTEHQSKLTTKNPATERSLTTQQTEDLPRNIYFQTHFSHLHENTKIVQNELNQLKQIASDLNTKLDKLSLLFHNQQALLLDKNYLRILLATNETEQ